VRPAHGFARLLVATFAGSCGGGGGGGAGDGGEDGGSASTSAAAECSGAAQRLRSCGLLSDGDDGCDRLDEQDEARCIFVCLQRATCDELETAICAGGDVSDVPSVQACGAACTERSGFRCRDGSGDVIPSDWECDTEADCADGSDEASCAGELFTCDGGNTMIPLDWQCDAYPDCADASDEDGCASQSFECADGSDVLPLDWQCDGEADCADASDEDGCEPRAELLCNGEPISREFSCADGSDVLPLDWQCDGEADCADGSDEFGCP
jgi:hypothetical protein